jgi:hypothetical protein
MNNLKPVFLGAAVASLLAGCGGEPEWVSVYEDCKEQVSAQTAEMNQSNQQAAGDNPQMQSMMNSMNSMASNLAFSACEMIRTTCEADADGPACRAYVEQSRKQ